MAPFVTSLAAHAANLRYRSVRVQVALLTGVLVLPLLALTAIVVQQNIIAERTRLEQLAYHHLGRLSEQIDNELRDVERAMMLLAKSPALRDGALDDFYKVANFVAQPQHIRISLRDEKTRAILMDTRLRPPDLQQPHRRPADHALAMPGPMSISGLTFDDFTDTFAIFMTIPVAVDGQQRYQLSAALDPTFITAMMEKEGLPAQFAAAVRDSNRVLVARSRQHDDFVGRALPAYTAHDELDRGVRYGPDLQGVHHRWYFQKTERGAFFVVIGIPQSVFDGPINLAMASIGVPALAFLGFAFLWGRQTSDRISEAVLGLTRIAHGPVRQPGRTALRETDEVSGVIAGLRARKEQQALAVEAARIGTFVRDLETNEIDWSDRATEILGLPRSEVNTRPKFYALLHESDRTVIEKSADAAVQNRDWFNFEYRVVHPHTGAVRWVSSRGRAEYAADGTPLRLHGVVIDMTDRQRAEADRIELRRQLMRAQEDERARLSRELHDQTAQSLVAIQTNAWRVQSRLPPEQREALQTIREQLNGLHGTLRNLAWELRPPALNELGLTALLTQHIARWSEQSGIDADFYGTANILDDLPEDVKIVIYRVVQEALTNIAKHATGATSSSIVVVRECNLLRIAIEDNGCGFQNDKERHAQSGLGLHGMRERLLLIGGTLDIETGPKGSGLFVEIALT